MTVRKCFGRPIAGFLAILLALPLGDVAVAHAQQTPSSAEVRPDGTTAPNPNPSADTSTNSGAKSAAPSSQDLPEAPATSSSQSNPTGSGSDQQSDQTKPLGAAAAPYTRPTGVMGSRPAGAVIAPAKQRRVHAILISIGIVAGAGIAIGTVAALSKGSPARP